MLNRKKTSQWNDTQGKCIINKCAILMRSKNGFSKDKTEILETGVIFGLWFKQWDSNGGLYKLSGNIFNIQYTNLCMTSYIDEKLSYIINIISTFSIFSNPRGNLHDPKYWINAFQWDLFWLTIGCVKWKLNYVITLF